MFPRQYITPWCAHCPFREPLRKQLPTRVALGSDHLLRGVELAHGDVAGDLFPDVAGAALSGRGHPRDPALPCGCDLGARGLEPVSGSPGTLVDGVSRPLS